MSKDLLVFLTTIDSNINIEPTRHVGKSRSLDPILTPNSKCFLLYCNPGCIELKLGRLPFKFSINIPETIG